MTTRGLSYTLELQASKQLCQFEKLSLSSHLQTVESTLGSNLLLQLHHALLITEGISGVPVQRPREVLVRVVGDELRIQDTQTLAVVGNLVPVALDVLQVTAEVGERALEDLAVHGGSHDRLHIDVFLVCLCGLGENVLGCALDGVHKLGYLFRVGFQECVVGNVQDRAEAAAAELRELVDAEHLDVSAGAVLRCEPLGQLDHLDVLEANTGVDGAVDDGLGDVHAAADGSVVVRGHAVVFGEFVDLNLYY